jgi:hypothetical protein
MKKISKISLKIAVVMIIFFSALNTVYALTDDYTMLTPLPISSDCGANSTTCKTSLSTYLPGMFKFAIGIAAVMAFVMITFGGIMYMTSDAISGKAQGREYVTNAVYGLLLVIGAWVILNTINPQILKFDLNLQKPSIQSATPTVTSTSYDSKTVLSAPRPAGSLLPGYTLSQTEVVNNKNMVNDLLGVQPIPITVNNNGTPCSSGGVSGCTNIVGEPQVAIIGVKGIAKDCGCALTITGGTEGGHQSHGPGIPAMDLSPTSGISSFLNVNTANLSNLQVLPSKTLTNGTVATFMWETNPPHWHVTYK